MPKVSRVASVRSKDVPDAVPGTSGTPISRRLRSRTVTSEVMKKTFVPPQRKETTTTDIDSDSEDFVIQKPKLRSKPKKVVKKPQSKKSIKKTPETESSESTSTKSSAEINGEKSDSLSSSEVETQEESTLSKKTVTVPSKIGAQKLSALKSNTRSSDLAIEKRNLIKKNTTSTSSTDECKTPKSKEKPVGNRPGEEFIEEEFPDIVQEFYTGNINFLTKNIAHQQLELNERKRLLEIRQQMDEHIRKFRVEAMKKTVELSNVFGNVKLCDVLNQMGNPSSLEKVVEELENVAITKQMMKGKLSAISEDSEAYSDAVSEGFESPSRQNPSKFSFPIPNKKGMSTPPARIQKINEPPVFTFGAGVSLIAHKTARLPKPGEVFYSSKGSPIVSHTQGTLGRVNTIELEDTDGRKIKVDMVLASGAPEKTKFFSEFVTDVRGMAATKSTVNHNRILPARVLRGRKGVSASTVMSAATNRKRN